jgi:signal transduction histidine kinase
MANPQGNSRTSSLRRPPQITVALDDGMRVLHVNRDLAGTGFPGLTNDSRGELHDLIHPGCGRDCRFVALLNKAWKSIQSNRESVEWEVDDPVWRLHLRLNLSRPPVVRDVAVERRQRFALLTVTDITEIRREYEAVLSSNRELQRKLSVLEEITVGAAANDVSEPSQAGRLNARILEAQERERSRIAADLHDGVAQTMGVVKYGVESRIADLKRRYPDMELSDFELLVEQIHEAIEDVRKISRNLSPSMLSDFGICTAIDLLCQEFGADIPNVEVVCAACVNEISIPESVKVAIFRTVQEALNNIGKHAEPTNVRVALTGADDGLTLEIRDDGNGFDAASVWGSAASTAGLGLASMRERVELTGGNFELMSAAGDGTTIRSSWPADVIRLV